jgi:hypothetical protein
MANQRYAILHHKLPDSEHWDLLLEDGNMLAAWQLAGKPTGPQALPLAATRIADHRKKYLVYEGPVSDNRGSVVRFDHGHYRVLERSEHRWLVHLAGQILFGRFGLVRSPEDPPEAWVLTTA